MKANTLIKLADGRRGRVVYNSLDGVGINLSEESLTNQEIEMLLGSCPLFDSKEPQSFPDNLIPKVMLREPYKGCNDEIEYVGDYEVVEAPHA